MTTAISTISRIPAKQAVLNKPSLVAVFLSYLHPFELIGNNGARTTCKQFHASLVLAIQKFVRTAHVIDKFNNKTWSGIRMSCTFLQKRDVVQTMPEVFSTMAQVRRLSLFHEDFHRDHPKTLLEARGFSHLTSLSFELVLLSDSKGFIQAIAENCPNLQHLRMPIMGMVDYSPLRVLQELQSVDVGHPQGSATDQTLETLSKVSSLTHVSLAACRNITYEGVASLLKGLPRLCSLNISGMCGQFPYLENQARIAETISEHGKNITHLDMAHGYYMNSRIQLIVNSCKLLKSLNISNLQHEGLGRHKSTRELAQFLNSIKPSLTVIVEEPQSK